MDYKQLQKGKTIYLTCFILLMFLVVAPSLSAAEWDNAISNYNETTQTVTIKNGCIFDISWTCLGDVIGEAKLITPLHRNIGIGYMEEPIHLFNLTAYQDYNDALKTPKLENIKNSRKEINREIEYRMLTYEDVEVPNYIETNCVDVTQTIRDCEMVEDGTRIERREVWTKVTPADLKKNEVVTIGVFADAKEGDSIDWIPLIYGVAVPQWASWNSSLKNGLVTHLTLNDQTGTTAEDYQGNNNFTEGSAPVDYNATGKIQTAFEMLDTDYMTKASFSGLPTGSSDRTVCSWNNVTSSNGDYIWGWGVASTRQLFTLATLGSGAYYFSSSGDDFTGNQTYSFSTWTFACVTYDGTKAVLYVNGVNNGEDTLTLNTGNTNVDVGVYPPGNNQGLVGIVDEWSLWNRTLSLSEIQYLYNSGNGRDITEIGDNPPEVVLIAPANDSFYNMSNTVNFEYNCTDDIQVSSCNLTLNGAVIYSNTSGVNGTYYYTDSYADGNYTWNATSTDNFSQSTTSESRVFEVSLVSGMNVTCLTPTSGTNSSQDLYNLTCVATDNNGIANTTFYVNGSAYPINTSGVNGTYILYNVLFPDGTHTWKLNGKDVDGFDINSSTMTLIVDFLFPNLTINAPVNDFNTSNASFLFNWNVTDNGGIVNTSLVGSNLTSCNLTSFNIVNSSGVNGSYLYDASSLGLGDCKYSWYVNAIDNKGKSINSTPRNFTIDSSAPTINVSSPVGNLGVLTNGDNLTLNFTAIDNNLDSCWYNYNGANTSVSCTNGTLVTEYFNYTFGQETITVYANDTFGAEGSSSSTFEFTIIMGGVSYTSPIVEGQSNTIIQNISLGAGLSVTDIAILNYSGTNFTTTSNLASGVYTITSSAPAPSVVTATNISFNFLVEVNSVWYSLTQSTQLVQPLNLTNCSSGDILMNISLFDERTRNNLTGDIEINIELKNEDLGSDVENLSLLIENQDNFLICLDPINSTEGYYMDAEIKYTSDGYSSELYFLQQVDPSNYPINLSLFDLDSNSSTEFKITYQDDTLVAISGAVVQLLRKYISTGGYETVEAPITSNLGTTVVHVDLDSNLYRAIVVKDGVVLDTFNDVIFNCESLLTGECEHKLLGEINPQNEVNYDTERDFAYSLFENDSVVTITYSVPSSTPAEVNIQLVQKDQFGNSTLCNQTLISSAGSIDCNIQAALGESYLDLKIYKDGLPIGEKSYIIPEAGGIDWLENNWIMIVVLILSLVGMAASSPEWIIINGILTMVISGMLWLANGLNFVMGLGMIMWLVIAAGILIAKLAKQEDR